MLLLCLAKIIICLHRSFDPKQLQRIPFEKYSSYAQKKISNAIRIKVYKKFTPCGCSQGMHSAWHNAGRHSARIPSLRVRPAHVRALCDALEDVQGARILLSGYILL